MRVSDPVTLDPSEWCSNNEVDMPNTHSLLHDPRLLDTGIAQLRRYGGGEPIILEGSDERAVFLIRTGCVRVSERIQLGECTQIKPGICDLSEGDVFGELSLLEAGPRLASVWTVEPTEVMVFDATLLVDYLDGNPEFGYLLLKELLGVVTSRLRQSDRRLGSVFAWGLKAHGIDRDL
jgi:CRP-like cAMP-binding protein